MELISYRMTYFERFGQYKHFLERIFFNIRNAIVKVCRTISENCTQLIYIKYLLWLERAGLLTIKMLKRFKYYQL